MLFSKVVGIIVLIGNTVVSASAEYGFVKVKATDKEETEVCAGFNTLFESVSYESNPPWKSWMEVSSVYPDLGCVAHSQNYSQKLVILKRGNCTFAEKAKLVQKANGSGVLIVSSDLLLPSATRDDYLKISIAVGIIDEKSYAVISDMLLRSGKGNVRVWPYLPDIKVAIDPSAYLMWIIAVGTCAAGAWLQGSSVKIGNEIPRPSSRSVSEIESSGTSQSNPSSGAAEIHLTPLLAVVFFVSSSITILLMYFFYDYLVYVLIGIFAYSSTMALFDLSYSAFQFSPCFVRYRINLNYFSCCHARPPILGLLLFLGCACLSVTWIVYRKAHFAWILQDILGAAFCLFLIKTIKLPSFKVSVLLLGLFFVYDIFYVFITPLLTKTNESVMVQVATGGSGTSREELPLLFKLPKISLLQFYKCVHLPYSLLGYGDIILPGLHVGLCACLDARISHTVRFHYYYIAAVFGYSIGMILTFVALYFMESGQPALLYLVPCSLMSTVFVALWRKELKDLWNGFRSVTTSVSSVEPAENHSLLDVDTSES